MSANTTPTTPKLTVPRLVKVKLEETRQFVDCLLLKEPIKNVEFRYLYSKIKPQDKVKVIDQGSALGWAKIMHNNQFISVLNVKYNKDEEGKALPDDEFRIESHETPHILCTQYFKDASLNTLLRTNNIRPPKANAPANAPRIPIVPSYIYAQKRLFVKWRYDIAVWWHNARNRIEEKKRSDLHFLLQQFKRQYPEYRSVETAKQWFHQVITRYEQAAKENKNIKDILETYHKELKKATDGVRKNAEHVAPEQDRAIDARIDQYKERLVAQKANTKSSKIDSSSEDSSSEDSSSEDSSDEDDSNSEDSEEEEASKKPAMVRKNFDDSSSDDSDEESSSEEETVTPVSAPLMKVTKVQPMATKQTVIPKQTTSVRPAQKRKNFESDSDSDNSSEDESDDAPKHAKKTTMEQKQIKHVNKRQKV